MAARGFKDKTYRFHKDWVHYFPKIKNIDFYSSAKMFFLSASSDKGREVLKNLGKKQKLTFTLPSNFSLITPLARHSTYVKMTPFI